MKILVPVKRVADYNAKIRVSPDGSGVDLSNVKMSANPFDEIALEEAVRIKESGVDAEVIAVTVGSAQAIDVLKTAFAFGVDRAILIQTDAQLEPLAVAKTLRALVEKENIDLVLMGKQAIDDDSNQTGQMLAGLLDYAQATFASKVEPSNGTVSVTREVDGGLEAISINLPAVITVDLRLNQPRYLTLPNIMKAKKKTAEEIAISALGIDASPRLKVLSTYEPEKRKSGTVYRDTDAFVSKFLAVLAEVK
ncbi:electron transfer flavoprotein subunit beta/FixA family protein [Leeia sp. TBRC 13508]|uniref:Electron transfer flavoprotein subunit beta n=1 Tax=Leeia speluncae TaxID=2884804 RepID=A0ABS8D8U4_9NEIS|nr:electron transfer flavoprotein subunit beta/FixA family protein [Leeia speluncae]MCB6184642.1 electron transfer flavoprotein subunit beta/FixA family protein [Leeia speluncae]